MGMMFIGSEDAIGFWFFAIIGSLLSSVIYGTITNRGFKGVKKSILMGGISAVVLIAVAISGLTGGFGYTKRIPQAQKIESVRIMAFSEYIDFTDPEMVLNLHQKIVNEEAYDTPNYYLESYNQLQPVEFHYTLKNGKTMSREFAVKSSLVADELLAIYKSEERLAEIKENVDTSAHEIRLYFHYENDSYDAMINSDDADKLLDAYWQDIQNCTTAVFEEKDSDIIEISGYTPIGYNKEDYYYFTLLKHNGFENTQQVLEEIIDTKIKTVL